MSSADARRSTAEARRAAIVGRAVPVFAKTGYYATPVTDIAAAAGISQAYVFRLFESKLGLFVAALDRCYLLINEALSAGAEAVADGTSAEVLEAMGDAYAELIADRDLLMLQVHAQSVSDIPEVRAAIRRGYASLVSLAYELSGGTRQQVQHFVAMGQLCHLIAAVDLDAVEETWARTLTRGMRHVPFRTRGGEST